MVRMSNPELPALSVEQDEVTSVIATGPWQVQALAQPQVLRNIQSALSGLPKGADLRWDLTALSALDHIGAQLLWNSWGKSRPPNLVLNESHEEFFKRLEET